MPRTAPVLGLLAALSSAALLAACSGSGTTRERGPEPFVAPPKPATQPAPPVAEILARSELPDPIPQPLDGDPMQVTVHRLENGLTVYISHDDQKPRFSAWIAVRAGSRQDPADSTGLAHYLEHMLFKGTQKIGTLDYEQERVHLDRIAALYDQLRRTGEEDQAARARILAQIDEETQASAKYAIPNEFDQLYSSLGIEGLNAFTSNDMTVYIADVPANRLEAWAKVEADRFAAPAWRLFFPELEVVYEEKNRSLDSPERRISEAMVAALFPNHPYGTQPTIGTVEHLKTPAYADMIAYFQRWYAPNNMAIALAGDIDTELALEVLEREFGRLEPRPLPLEKRAPPAPRGRVERVVEAEGEDAVFLSWRTVDVNHDDQSALVVMDWLVDNDRSGLLNVELLLSQKLPAAGSYGQFYYEAGAWVLRGTAREGQTLEEVEALLTGVVDKLKRGEFTQEDIDAIVVNEEIREKQSLESTGSRVFRMVSSFIHRTPWATEAGRLDRLRKVTREDVVRVANQYLGGDMVVVKRVKGVAKPPQIDKPKITPVKIDPSRSSRFAKEVRAMETEPLEPEWLVAGEHYSRHKLPAGELVAVENPRNDLFAVSYMFEVGQRRQRLLCHALELLERSGAGDLSAEAVQRAMFAIGTSITTSCSADGVRIDVRGIDRNLEESLALLDRWLRSPRFTGETVSKLAENTLSQRKDRTQDPRFVASAAANFALYGNNSPNLLEPSNSEIQRASGPALSRLLSALPDHQHRTTYFGPRPAAEAAAIIGLGRKHRRVKPRDPLRYRATAAPQVFFTHQTTAQAQVRIAWRHPPMPNDQRLVSRLFTEYVGGGMGSLVFQEIREARGLAYSAWAYHAATPRPKDETALIAGMGTQADKTAEAMAAMFEILGGLTIDPQRLETARASLDQEFRASRVDPRWAAAWVLSWDDQGFRSDPRPDQWKALAETGAPSLEQFGRVLVKGSPVVSIHGDRDRIDLEALAERHGKIVEVPISDLFSY